MKMPSCELLIILAMVGCGRIETRKDGNADKRQAAKETPGLPPVDPACLNAPPLSLHAALSADAKAVASSVIARLPPWIEVDVSPGETGRAGARHHDVTLGYAGVPLCGHKLRANIIGTDLSIAKFPLLAAEAPRLAHDSISETVAIGRVESELIPTSSFEVLRTRACWHVDAAGALHPARALDVIADKLPWQAITDGEHIHDLTPLATHLDAEAVVYARNSLSGSSVKVTLRDLSPSDRLANPRFRLVNGDLELDGPTAADGRFSAAPGEAAFADVSIFAHAEEMMSWYDSKLTMTLDGCAPISLMPHAETPLPDGTTTPNNALYIPSWGNPDGHPVILMGDGDGKILKELGTDFDPVAHELGHHIVSQRLKSVKGESLVLHEGLADYFVFAYTGNTCLGESICPSGSAACYVPDRCLRTADVEFKFHDETFKQLKAHFQGQAVSGLLMALGKDSRIGKDTALSLAFGQLDFLSAAAGYADLVAALVAADKAANNGAHACFITEIAATWGLASEVAAISCK